MFRTTAVTPYLGTQSNGLSKVFSSRSYHQNLPVATLRAPSKLSSTLSTLAGLSENPKLSTRRVREVSFLPYESRTKQQGALMIRDVGTPFPRLG